MHNQEDGAIFQSLVHRRAENGLMAKFLNRVMPPDPRPAFVWPQLVVAIGRKHLRTRCLAIAAAALLVATIGLVFLLLQVPFLDQSAVTLLTRGFEAFIPRGWATGAAWTVGMVSVMSIGSVTNYDYTQRDLQSIPATRSKLFDFVLMVALQEEQLFRSGSEQWSWPQRIRASMIFGIVHITNIWYSLAAGLALGLTGFGFLLVYHWYYRRTQSQLVATAASATVHAIYNMMALVLIIIVIAVNLVV